MRRHANAERRPNGKSPQPVLPARAFWKFCDAGLMPVICPTCQMPACTDELKTRSGKNCRAIPAMLSVWRLLARHVKSPAAHRPHGFSGFATNSIQIYREIDIRHFPANDITPAVGCELSRLTPARFIRDADAAAPERFQ